MPAVKDDLAHGPTYLEDRGIIDEGTDFRKVYNRPARRPGATRAIGRHVQVR
jgi:hypothetical protein